jgi:BlaI family penicillinase repressor
MPDSTLDPLSRREREVIHILYALGKASATEVQAELPEGTKNAATRKILTALLRKKVIARTREGKQYIYTPVHSPGEEGVSALRQVLRTFFQGSFCHGLLGMVELGREQFTETELEQIREIIKPKTR